MEIKPRFNSEDGAKNSNLAGLARGGESLAALTRNYAKAGERQVELTSPEVFLVTSNLDQSDFLNGLCGDELVLRVQWLHNSFPWIWPGSFDLSLARTVSSRA